MALPSLWIKIHPVTVKVISSTSITQAKIIPTLNESATGGDKDVIKSKHCMEVRCAYIVCIPSETQSVTSVASFTARVARAAVVLTLVVVGKELVSNMVIDMLFGTLAVVLAGVSDGVFAEVNFNASAAAMSMLKFDKPTLSGKSKF